MRVETDIVVVGSGIAGLFFALKAAEQGAEVLLLTKDRPEESNTAYAQGGIASVLSKKDSFEAHVRDTLVAGDGLCRESIVWEVVREAPSVIEELIRYGVEFDREPAGALKLGREGGHSYPRIVHSGGDATGAAISQRLLEAVRSHPRIQMRYPFFALDLITQHHLGIYVNRGYPSITCYGIYALEEETGKIWTILAKAIVLASGGAGQVYPITTNPPTATGDGVAMALRAKARIANMEFFQFHPTALYEPEKRPAFLLTEALRGAGARLLDPIHHKPFMAKYDSRAELAPRDIVARAIDSECKIAGVPYVYLDARPVPDLPENFPTIYSYCLKKGLDPKHDLLPVAPAAHYMVGGIDTDRVGRTSIRQLYAIGEVSYTGLHGANRLASNSLLEAVAFAKRAAADAVLHLKERTHQREVPDWDAQGSRHPDEMILISHNLQELRVLMGNYVGIVRSNFRLERAWRRIALLYEETEAFYKHTYPSRELFELRNLIAVAYLIVKCASLRRESRGLHYTLDYPEKRREEGVDILV
ncbi:MAG: L-aspartate oxidase [Bacteroidia bacterium]|nr:L-aspartate oxidase [Bacteroidia bacterium]MDW8236380.1 L-aspartate oxidase [Bacteroidia bacterium]